MQSLLPHIREHFCQQWDRIASDPVELQRRLARRRSATMQRPLRSFCIALRAADRRLEQIARNAYTPAPTRPLARAGATPPLLPQHARPISPDDFPNLRNKLPHDVRLTVALIRLLIAPVTVYAPGEEVTEIARRLGCVRTGLRGHIRKGRFSVRHCALLGGKKGRPVPVLHPPSDSIVIDPNMRGLLRASDRDIWADRWAWHADSLPPDFTQTVRRIWVVHHDRTGRRIPGSSWRWQCPGCERAVQKLFCPIRIPDVEQAFRLWKRPHDELRDVPPPMTTFACERCHRVQGISRAEPNGWNVLVTYVTAGLLYGSEVPKPAGWHQRQTVPHRKPNARAPKARNELRDLLVDTDLNSRQIAKYLNRAVTTVRSTVWLVYKQYGVHSRAELRERIHLIRAADPTAYQTNAAARAIA